MFVSRKKYDEAVKRAEKAEDRVSSFIDEITELNGDKYTLESRLADLDHACDRFLVRAQNAEKDLKVERERVISLQEELARYRRGLALGTAAAAAKRKAAKNQDNSSIVEAASVTQSVGMGKAA